MIEFHAAYYRIEDDWYLAKMLDYPGVISQGSTLRSARLMIRDALKMMATSDMEEGRPLPTPNPKAKDRKAEFLETISLKLRVQTGRIRETA